MKPRALLRCVFRLPRAAIGLHRDGSHLDHRLDKGRFLRSDCDDSALRLPARESLALGGRANKQDIPAHTQMCERCKDRFLKWDSTLSDRISPHGWDMTNFPYITPIYLSPSRAIVECSKSSKFRRRIADGETLINSKLRKGSYFSLNDKLSRRFIGQRVTPPTHHTFSFPLSASFPVKNSLSYITRSVSDIIHISRGVTPGVQVCAQAISYREECVSFARRWPK